MPAIKGIIQHGQVVLSRPAELPDGTEVHVVPVNAAGLEEPPAEIQFMSEQEQADDPPAVQQWIDELQAIPPLPMTAQQEAEMLAWRQKSKEFNLEAVRRQMQEGIP